MKKQLLFSQLSFLFLIILNSVSHQSIGQCDRKKVVDDYNNIYLQTAITATELGWTGDTSTCKAGTISKSAMDKTFEQINYFRRLAGIEEIRGFDSLKNVKSQEAALMMYANGKLDHYPPATWKCFTTYGEEGAGSSNLASGLGGPMAITNFMRDAGAGNEAIGHRRWILFPRAGYFGFGATPRSAALWVIGGTIAYPDTIKFTSYPSRGFFPAPLVFSRWSFSVSNADFSSAVVEMTDTNKNVIALTQHPVTNGYGDNTFVWEPKGIVLNSASDVIYIVNIKNVKVKNVSKSYSYEVKIVQPTHPPVCVTGFSWSEKDCGCIKGIATSMVEKSNKNFSINPNPATSQSEINLNMLASGSYEIINSNGRTVYSSEFSNTENVVLDLRDLSDGSYIVLVKTIEGVQVLKLLKN